MKKFNLAFTYYVNAATSNDVAAQSCEGLVMEWMPATWATHQGMPSTNVADNPTLAVKRKIGDAIPHDWLVECTRASNGDGFILYMRIQDLRPLLPADITVKAFHPSIMDIPCDWSSFSRKVIYPRDVESLICKLFLMK